MMAQLIAARLPKLEGNWLLIPVPLHRTRLWHRGFNQAGLLARRLGQLTGHSLLVDGLVRTQRTQSLGGLGRKARERALSGAIAVNSTHSDRLKGAKIVLVDDVLTSGATSDACVRSLKKGGAESVIIACFSRVLNEAVRNSPDQESETPEIRKSRAPRDE
ncbi:ComF family protein [Pontixanthobacter aquaemixtae]|nr:phosphoribosyltransferase family protein [Pontixanthobacter aquaemixtae]